MITGTRFLELGKPSFYNTFLDEGSNHQLAKASRVAHTQVFERRVPGVCRQWVTRKRHRHEGSNASQSQSQPVCFPRLLKKKTQHAATSHERDSTHECAPRNATRRPPPATNHQPTAARSLPSPRSRPLNSADRHRTSCPAVHRSPPTAAARTLPTARLTALFSTRPIDAPTHRRTNRRTTR